MARQLRPRKSQPSYAKMLQFEDNEEAEPLSAPIVEEGVSSGSDFEPEKAKAKADGEEEEEEDEDEGEGDEDVSDAVEEDDDEDVVGLPKPRRGGAFSVVTIAHQRNKSSKGKGKATSADNVKSMPGPVGLALRRTSKRQMYVLPTPSVHHRHRAVPLFARTGRVERLASPPKLFSPVQVAMTNNFTQNAKVTDRVNKAWGYNVGCGPLWEMVEDRGWYKEARVSGNEMDSEARRRPRVYTDVCVKDGWEVLSSEKAAPYIPTDTVTTEEGNLKPPPPVPCFVGPITTQTRLELEMFDTFHMSSYIPESKAHIFNAGAPVWGLDWCPIHIDDRAAHQHKQYLGVAPYPSRSHSPEIGVKVARPSYACVQIWSLGATNSDPAGKGKGKATDSGTGRPTSARGRGRTGSPARGGEASPTRREGAASRSGLVSPAREQVESSTSADKGKGKGPSKQQDDPGVMKCEMVLCLDSGPAHEIKWCPLPAHDVDDDDNTDAARPRKLGIFAGSFEDGSLSIYAVPDPRDITPVDHDPELPVYVKLPEPLLRIELEETSCWTVDWANSECIAVGTTNGIIAVYDIGPALKSCNKSDSPPPAPLLPTHYITVHQSAIRALAWIRAPPSWGSGAPRVDGDPTVIASGGYDGMECMTDVREGHGSVMNRTRDVINAMAFSPFAGGPITIDHENTVKAYSASPSMLGRGHTLLEPQGPVWSVNASDYHPQLAVGSADGSCSTTNTLRSTRRGGSVPFFVHKIYQMDYSRNTGEYRMIERFLPQETQDRPAATRAAKDKGKGTLKPAPISATGAWPQEVGVHRVVWNSCNGLAAAGLLASATSSGLCRVDLLWGRWIKGKLPYGGVEHVRMELDEDAMDVDSDESGSS